jgi:replicative DNA helicase
MRADPRAERAVAGAALLAPHALPLLAPLVRPEDFADARMGAVFGAALALHGRGEPVDVVTVAHALRQAQRLNAVGGDAFLGELCAAVATTAHAEAHARLVAGHARARRAAAAFREALCALEDGAQNADEALAVAEAKLAAVAKTRAVAGVVKLAASIDAAMQAMEDVATRRRPAGTTTGLRDLDRLLGGGLRPGELIVVAGRPAMGKSALATGIWRAAVRATGRPGLYASLEMPHAQLTTRELCGAAGVDLQRARAGAFADGDPGRLLAAANDLYDLPAYILDDSETDRASVADVRAAALRLRQDGGALAVVVIDYLQLVRAEGKHDSREREVATISAECKRLAKQLAVPVVLLAQLNRGPETRGKEKRPQVADLRESGAIEQDADVVALLYRDEVYNPQSPDRGVAEVILGKQRSGPTGTARVRFVKEEARFCDLAEDDARRAEDGEGYAVGSYDAE